MDSKQRLRTVTMRDVAREVGLSVTTVSRALNDYDDVSAETRERIRAAARRLDYHPNALARSLQNSRANAVALQIPVTFHRAYDIFWQEFIGGMAATCAEREVDLLLSTAAHGGEVDDAFARLVRGGRVDGVLLCDVRRADPRVAYLQKIGLPFVAFGRTVETQDYAFVDVDGAAGVSAAVMHLLNLGHERFAYLGVDPDFGFAHFRRAGYEEALRMAGAERGTVYEGLTEATAPVAVTRLLQLAERPTALIAAADFLGVAALRAAGECGLAIPRDLSIVVFDDNPLVWQCIPPLTAVSQPNRRLGAEAAAMLIERIAQPDGPLAQRLIVPNLVVRGSAATPPHRAEPTAVA